MAGQLLSTASSAKLLAKTIQSVTAEGSCTMKGFYQNRGPKHVSLFFRLNLKSKNLAKICKINRSNFRDFTCQYRLHYLSNKIYQAVYGPIMGATPLVCLYKHSTISQKYYRIQSNYVIPTYYLTVAKKGLVAGNSCRNNKSRCLREIT